MKKIYYLSTCDTCQKILKEIDAGEKKFDLQDIKVEKISPAQLEEMYALAGSYDALFSKRAKLYQSMKLKNQPLSEKEKATLILKEYTFLKRPVIMWGKQIFIGNNKKTINAIRKKCKEQ